MSSVGLPWEVSVIVGPLLAAMIAATLPGRQAAAVIVAAASTLASTLALGTAVLESGVLHHRVGGWGAPLGIELRADGMAVFMLGVVTTVMSVVSIHSLRYFHSRDSVHTEPFWPLWFFLWTGLNALFLSADLFNVYVTLELVSLASVVLITRAGRTAALTAGIRYLLASLTGSLCYLMAVALLYAQYGRLDMAGLATSVQPSLLTYASFALFVAALLLKSALFPLHFWLPAAHANAPGPVSAILSALVVKTSFYLLLRLWFEVFHALPLGGASSLIGALAAAAVIWGSVQALAAERLKVLVAYSTVAQLGYLFLAFPLASQLPDGELALDAAMYLVLAHALAKGAMFLSAGTILHAAGHDRIDHLSATVRAMPVTTFALALAGVSLIGLPPSSGFIGKWLLLSAGVAAQQWWLVIVVLVGGVLAAGYVFRILVLAFATGPETPRSEPALQSWTAFALALLAIVTGLVAPLPLELLHVGSPHLPPRLEGAP